jgi:outer membrane immunogenic protein
MRSCAFAVVIALFGIGPALAADLPPPASPPLPPPILPSYSWTGWYGGLQLGGAWEKSNWRLFSQTGSGFLYGGQLGFNYQIDQFVFGAEGDVTGSTLKADSICAAVAGTNCRTSMDYLASLRA